MASTRLLKTLGTPTNGKKFTWSAWVKRAKLGGDQVLFNANNAGSTNVTFRFNSNNKLYFFYLLSSSMIWQYETSAIFRDTNGWMHIVFAYDSTLGTNSDRIKIYVNGTRVTNFDAATHASQDVTNSMNSAVAHYIGDNGGSNQFDGSMSHIHFTDGYTYQASSFGSTDATTGEWKINTSPSVTYGNNGFFILKDGNSLTDQSGNSNNWSVDTGTLTKTEDNPSNVFATLNPLVTTASTPSFTQGNNTVSPSAGAYQNHFSTIGMTGGGKYYWEMKVNGSPNSANYHGVSSDIELNNLITVSNIVGYTSTGYSLVASSGNKYNNTNSSSYGSALADGDIMMGALDLDNGKIWFGKNGTWFNSGNPASGTNEAFSSISASNIYFPSGTVYNGGFSSINFNFGNGYFGTTAVASAGTNASNNGIFEYDVPAGYTALSTKGLNS